MKISSIRKMSTIFFIRSLQKRFNKTTYTIFKRLQRSLKWSITHFLLIILFWGLKLFPLSKPLTSLKRCHANIIVQRLTGKFSNNYECLRWKIQYTGYFTNGCTGFQDRFRVFWRVSIGVWKMSELYSFLRYERSDKFHQNFQLA